MGKKNKKHKKEKKEKKQKEQQEQEKKEQAAPEKKAKKKDDSVVVVKHSKAQAVLTKDLHPITGSRFAPNTSGQIALEIVVTGAKAGKDINAIREELGAYRKENNKPRNLDPGYFPFVVASHPEFFEVRADKSIKLLKEFEPDPDAVEKLKNKEEERKQKSKDRMGGKKEKKDKKDKKKAKGGKKPLLNKK